MKTIEKPQTNILLPIDPPMNWSLRDFGANKPGEAMQVSLTPGGEPSLYLVGDQELYTFRHGFWHQNRGNEKVEGPYSGLLTKAWNSLVQEVPSE